MPFSFDLNTAPDSLKSVLINLFLLPFWFISIFLFNGDFYNSADFILAMAFSLCLTIASSMAFAILNTIGLKDNKGIFDVGQSTFSVYIQIIWICILIFLCYSLRYFDIQTIDFFGFVVCYFGLIFLLILLESVEKTIKYFFKRSD